MIPEFTESPALHTDQSSLIGLAKLMRLAYSGVDLFPLGAQLIAQAESPECNANTLMDLSTVLQLRGDHDLALVIQTEALTMQQIYSPPTVSDKPLLKLLALVGRGDLMANTPLEFLLENSDIALDLLYVAENLPLPGYLPDHDVLFVAIGECDENIPLLHEIAKALQGWPRPILNNPLRIALLSRDSACALLSSTPFVLMPQTARLSRQNLEQIGLEEQRLTEILSDGVFPLIVRPVDSHAGKGLAKLDSPASVAAYLAEMNQTEFYISRFIDYRSQDGLFRKYRIVLIEGRPFICHMAISSHWMIHYLNAGMAESADKRAEEEKFMLTFDEVFAQRHQQAFQSLYERMELDYLGIDCGETPDGNLLIFEVDSNMIVHAIDPVELFPYKQPQMQKVFAAFRKMLFNACQQTPQPNSSL